MYGHGSELDNLPLVRAIPRVQPLWFEGDALYCCRFNELLVTEDLGGTFRSPGSFPVASKWRAMARLHPTLQRLSRLQAFRMRVSAAGAVVLALPPGVYSRAAGADRFRVFDRANGSRPISLCATPEGRWVFGEYPQNADRSLDIRVFGSFDEGASWQVLHTFPRDTIRHIHGITWDRWERCFWLCTGNFPRESTVYRADENFTDVRPIATGSVATRFVWLHATEDVLIGAGDSPRHRNHITAIDKKTGEPRQLQAVQNTSFFCGVAGDRLFVSTTGEPPGVGNVQHVNDSGFVYVWSALPPFEQWTQVLALRTDPLQRAARRGWLPRSLFQYSTFAPAEGVNNSGFLAGYAMGLRGHAGSMLVFDIRNL